jgi:hypothetical protein
MPVMVFSPQTTSHTEVLSVPVPPPSMMLAPLPADSEL